MAKTLMQVLWKEKLDWDSQPPQHICEKWFHFKSSFSELSKLSLPRCIFASNIQRCQILAFSDASERGYACAVYLRIELPDAIKSSLI